MTRYARDEGYVKFIPEEIGGERAAYRENYDQFVDLNQRYDSDNLFHLIQNVTPTA